MQNFMLNLLRKNSLKKSSIPEARQTLKILDVTISSHIISFWFLLISGHLQATQKSQNWLIQSRKVSCNWGKEIYLIISKGKIFRANQNKCFAVITGELVSALCLQQYFGDHKDLFISSSLFYFSFVIDNAKPTSLYCMNIYSCILSLLKLQGTFCFMNQMCCIYLILTKSVLVRYTNLFDF